MTNFLRRLAGIKTIAAIGIFLTTAIAIYVLVPTANKAPTRTPQTAREFEENAEKRFEAFMLERTFPTGKIPDNARRDAWESRPEDAQSNLLAASQWQSVGPLSTQSDIANWGLTSGRINAIAVSPSNSNLILLGASTGGVWRSTDGGTTFAPTTDNQVDLAVGSIAFAPSDNSIVYAGMGDKASGYYGSGVLKSTDGGQSWTRVNNNTLPSPGRVSKILVDPANSNRVYVAQYAVLSGNSSFASGFFLSNDGGINWTRTIAGLPRDLVQHPTQPNTYYLAMARVDLATPTNGGVFKSTDGCATWTRVYTSPYATTSNMKIAVTPAAPQSLYVVTGQTSPSTAAQLETSPDEGANWTNRGSNFDVGQLSYNFYLFVHPTDPNTIYVGTRDLWRSTNLGVAFTNITNNFSIAGAYNPFNSKAHPDQHHFFQSTSNPNLIYIANDGGFYRSTDGAASFQSLNASLNLTQFTGIDLHPTDNTRTYGGTQDNGNQRRRGGSQWREFISGDGGQIVVDPVDPTFVYSTYVRNDIDRWSNNTDTYNGEIGNSTIFNADRVAFYPPFTGNNIDSTLYFGTYRLYISTNRGTNWTAPAGATDLTLGGGDVLSAIGVARSNTNTIYTGSSQGRVMASTNGGVNWTQVTTGLPARFIKSIVVSRTDPNTAYLTVSGFDSGHVFKTTNGGTNWTDISGNLPNIPTNTLLIDVNNPATLYVGTDVGVFRSTTDGTTWETFNNGMPPVIVTELDQNASGLIQASTYGRGAYEVNPALARKSPADFDGDGKTDISIFRSDLGQWWLNRSASGLIVHTFGNAADKITPADFTGDGSADVAIWRPSNGEWYVLRSENFTFYSFPFGTSGDTPVAGDYDGDGKADAAVFRPGNSTWYIQRSTGGTTITGFGAADDKPVPGDFDGDGKDDIAIYRPSVGQWWLNRSTAGVIAVTFGNPTDKPVSGDYTGDGKADIAIWRPSNGEWFILRSENSTFYSFPFGASGDKPVPGDYDGDGKWDAGVFRPTGGTWYVSRSTSGLLIQNFGNSTDSPVPGFNNP
ncbi:MAG: VCBS repeat-containing protein [Acidobacteria bacterium]|nr:VCBS repeat-containing protein [Acidobacteriota bacterium]